MLLTLSGCQSGGGGGGSASAGVAASPDAPTPAASPSPTPTPTPSASITGQPVTVTYYSKTSTTAPVNGWPLKTVTMTGHCMIYASRTYCWDSGLTTLAQWNSNSNWYGPYSYTYFGYGDTGHCSGGCTGDPISTPSHLSQQLINNIPAQTINDIFNLGTGATLNCTDDGSTVDCGAFQIDLNRADI